MSWYTPYEPEADALGPVSRWSFSTLKNFESCPHKVYVSHVLNIKEPAGPAAQRGTEMHAMIEDYIQGKSTTLPPKLKPDMVDKIDAFRAGFNEGRAYTELEVAFTRKWEPIEWNSRWAGFIVDAYEKESPTCGYVVDWKSGRSFGNELKHAEQLMFYADCIMHYDPEIEFVKCEIGYLDEGKMGLERTFTRRDIAILHPGINVRANLLTTATTFPPQPSKENCKWCKYKEMRDDNGALLCEVGAMYT